jgi:hypothetical protein
MLNLTFDESGMFNNRDHQSSFMNYHVIILCRCHHGMGLLNFKNKQLIKASAEASRN